MKKLFSSLALLAAMASSPAYAQQYAQQYADKEFTVSSDDFFETAPIDMKHVFNGFGCDGENISPEVSWSGAPRDTKSFAVTVYDPDAPTGSGWWHWVVFNIPAGISNLPRGVGTKDGKLMAKGVVQSVTDFGTTGYGGPCPPEGHGKHRYIITVHALDVEKLGVDATASGALVGYMLHEHGLAKASTMGKYGR